jgi:phage recombination protein Bet
MGELTVIKTDKGDINLSPKIIKQYLVRGNGAVTDSEAMMFLSLCKFQNLNPFINEAFLIKFGGQPATMVVGKEVFTKRAFQHPKFRGLRAGVIVDRGGELIEIEGSFKKPDDVLLGGWAEVHVENRVPFKNSVSLKEYEKYKKDGTLQSTWNQIPCTMIRKVALVQALREAFPECFQGMYSQEEMPVDNEMLDGLQTVVPPDECVVEEKKETPKAKLVTVPQVKRMFTVAGKKGLSDKDVKATLKDMFGIESSKEMTVNQYEEAMTKLESLPDIVEVEKIEENKEAEIVE